MNVTPKNLKLQLKALQENLNVIHEFIMDYDLDGVIYPDFGDDLEHSFPYTGEKDPELNTQGLQFKCPGCKEFYDSAWDYALIAYICSKECFRDYYTTSTYFRAREKELATAIESVLPELKVISEGIDKLTYDLDEEDFEMFFTKHDTLSSITSFWDESGSSLQEFSSFLAYLGSLQIEHE